MNVQGYDGYCMPEPKSDEMNESFDYQEYDGYYMPEPDEVKRIPESELEKLIEETKAKFKKKSN